MPQVKIAKTIANLSAGALIAAITLSCSSTNATYLDEETGEVVVVAESELDNEGMLGAGYGGVATSHQINNGDPLAARKSFGLSRAYDATRIRGAYGEDAHLFTLDFGFNNKRQRNYQVEYTYLSDSDQGVSIEFLGSDGDDRNGFGSTVSYAQKLTLHDNVMIVPKVGIGSLFGRLKDGKTNTDADSVILKSSLHTMYSFDSGHWLYAKPQTAYINHANAWSSNLELGGGYMLNDHTSVGFKYDITHFKGHSEAKGWFEISYNP
ncbi:hypothetical protein VIOR3934_00275 [Vibrio orientalis CIP 102891 = ATCC 33934]|uniref:Lipoprotein n=1 Tax=Vibrio orientalis CIP 102891 = ATCC 33934 TaxID=675816 RepID=C9QGR7_VIBOR|nr:hypothetical protein [Vibrio orientalis]EEX93778.1 hypothetical protein VIA_000935 [Vibrio orientalis CIP 102891 = ATCC 33934]EGU50786.1 hypothetical protein VIOR3934_00275 [Vibrio orientalis CIP 102891 = ATCC 33934]